MKALITHTRTFAAGVLAFAGFAASHAQELNEYSECNEFTFNLFEEAMKADEENIAMSPLSLEISLAMLQNGANGNTRDELTEAIGMSHLTKGEINEYYKGMLDQLTRGIYAEDSNEMYFFGNTLALLDIANSIWIDKSSSIQPGFSMDCTNWYNAGIYNTDLKGGEGNAAINNWLRTRLGDLAPSVEVCPEEDLSILILNTMLFYADWCSWLDPSKTKDELFTNADASRVMFPTMYDMADYRLAMTDNFDMLELPLLPFRDNAFRFSMSFYLPQHGNDVLTTEEYNYLHSHLNTEHTIFYLPKFAIDDNHSMVELLQRQGVHDAFSSYSADFSGVMTRGQGNLFLSSIQQPCHVEIDERGVKALTVTRTGGLGYLPQKGVVTLRFNRPFYFTIEDNEAKVVLFIGRVSHLEGPAADPGIEDPASVERVVTDDSATSDGTYDLSGRRVAEGEHHGVAIENGRKVVR